MPSGAGQELVVDIRKAKLEMQQVTIAAGKGLGSVDADPHGPEETSSRLGCMSWQAVESHASGEPDLPPVRRAPNVRVPLQDDWPPGILRSLSLQRLGVVWRSPT